MEIISLFICIVVFIISLFGLKSSLMTFNINGVIGTAFVSIMMLIVFVCDILKMLKNARTGLKGEKAYARIMECVKTGNFILNKDEYKVIVSAYISSIGKVQIFEEKVGLNTNSQYIKNNYLQILYYKNDINIIKNIEKSDVPMDILGMLEDSNVEPNYLEWKSQKEAKAQETQDRQEEIAYQTSEIVQKANQKINPFIKFIGLYSMNLILMDMTGFFNHLLTIVKTNAFTSSSNYLYPILFTLAFITPIPTCFCRLGSRWRIVGGISWFLTVGVIMFTVTGA